MELASLPCVSGAVEEVEDPWGPSAVDLGYCGALEEQADCPIATLNVGRVGSLLPEAQVLASAPWSSSHAPLCSP